MTIKDRKIKQLRSILLKTENKAICLKNAYRNCDLNNVEESNKLLFLCMSLVAYIEKECKELKGRDH